MIPHDFVPIFVGNRDQRLDQCARCNVVRFDSHTEIYYFGGTVIVARDCTRGDMTEERAVAEQTAPRLTCEHTPGEDAKPCGNKVICFDKSGTRLCGSCAAKRGKAVIAIEHLGQLTKSNDADFSLNVLGERDLRTQATIAELQSRLDAAEDTIKMMHPIVNRIANARRDNVIGKMTVRLNDKLPETTPVITAAINALRLLAVKPAS